MGITYKDFMKYKNDSSLYAGLNEKNKKIFWEYGESNQLIPFDAPPSAVAEKNKYVRPGYVNPRLKETGPNPAYGMTQGQEKSAIESMRKQSGDYLKQQQLPTNVAQRNERNAIATKVEQDEIRKKVAGSVAFKQPSTVKAGQPSVMPNLLGNTPLKTPDQIVKSTQEGKPNKRIQEVLLGIGAKPTPEERKQANDFALKTKQGAFASAFWKGVPFGGSADIYKDNKEAISEGQSKFPKSATKGAIVGGLTGQGLTYALASPVIGATKLGQAALKLGKGAIGAFAGKQALELGIDAAIQTPQEVVKAINNGSTFGEFAKSWGESMALSVLFNGVVGGGAEAVKTLKNTLSSADALKSMSNLGIDQKAVTDAFKALDEGNPEPLRRLSDNVQRGVKPRANVPDLQVPGKRPIYVNPQGTASTSLARAEMPLDIPSGRLALEAPRVSKMETTTPKVEQPVIPNRGVKPISDRSFEEVGNRSVKAYQFENPEVKPFYREQAQELLGDLKDTQGGRKTFVEDELGYKFGGEKRITSQLIADIKDSTNASYAKIKEAIEKIIKDNGLENNALSKRIEMIIDDSLVNGYKSFDGTVIPPNMEYINVKNVLDGVQYKQFINPDFDAWAKNLTGKQDFTPQEIDGLKRVYENQTGKSVDTPEPFDFSAKVSREVPRTVTPDQLAESRLRELGNRVRSGEVSQAEGEVIARRLVEEAQTARTTKTPDMSTLEGRLKAFGQESEVARVDMPKDTSPTIDVPVNSNQVMGADIRRTTTQEMPETKSVTPSRIEVENEMPNMVLKERGFSENVRTDANRPEPIRQSLDTDPLFYQQLADTTVLKSAQSRMAKGFDEALNDFDLTKDVMRADNVVLAKLLIDEASKIGDIRLARRITADIAESLTTAGQFSQAAKILRDSNDPSSILMFVEKELKKLNKQGTGRYGKKWNEIRLTEPENVIVQRITADATDAEKELLFNELFDSIAKRIPTTRMEQFDSWRRISMLLNPKTHVRNIVGNTAMAGVKSISDTLDASMQKFLKQEARTRTFKSTPETKQIAAEYFEANKKDLLEGGRWELFGIRSPFAEKRIFKNDQLEFLNNLSKNTLEAEDAFFMKRHFTNDLANFMSARKIKEPTQEAVAYALRRAQEATFREANAMSEAINKMKSVKGWGKLVDTVVPFVKTPANILKTGVKYSPLGMVEGIGGLITQGNPQLAIETLAKGLTGTGLTLVGAWAAKNGFVRGNYKGSSEEGINELTGTLPNSVITPKGSFSVDFLQPSAIPFFMGVAAMEEAMNNEDANAVDVALSSLIAGGDALINQSLLKGIKTFIGGYGSTTEKILQTPIEYLKQAYPTLGGQIARSIDPVKRQTDFTGFVPKTVTGMQARIPLASKELPPKRNILGEAQTVGKVGVVNTLNQFFNPSTVSKRTTNPIALELEKLVKLQGTDMLPSTQTYKFTNNKKEIKMDNKEVSEFQRIQGETASVELSKLFDSIAYKDGTSEEKEKLVTNVFDYAKQIAKAKIVKNRGE